MVSNQGQTELRSENVERAVRGIANKKFRMMQVLSKDNSSDNTETFYRETTTILTGGTGQAIQGVARGADFPHVNPSWTKHSAVHIKFAARGTVFMEDRLTSAIDVQARTIFKVGEAIAEAVDQYIYTQLTGATGIGTAAAIATWDNATEGNREPITDILIGIQNLDENNFDVLENGFLLLSPKDYRNLLRHSRVINNPSFKTADVVSNGRVGQIAGLTIIKSTTVDADEAMIIVGQRAAAWKTANPLTTVVIPDQGIKTVIRAWQRGHIQIWAPAAIYVITNTQA